MQLEHRLSQYMSRARARATAAVVGQTEWMSSQLVAEQLVAVAAAAHRQGVDDYERLLNREDTT